MDRCKAERAERGEEINYHFVADVLKIGIEQYNHAVIKLKEELADPVKLLAMLEDHVQNLPEGASEECINKELGKARDRICSRLTEIGWRESSGNFVSLDYKAINIYIVCVCLFLSLLPFHGFPRTLYIYTVYSYLYI